MLKDMVDGFAMLIDCFGNHENAGECLSFFLLFPRLVALPTATASHEYRKQRSAEDGSGMPSMQDLQKWAEQSQSSEDYKQMTLKTFEAAPQWLAERRVDVKWKPLSASSNMERENPICLQVRQISASPAVVPLSNVPKVAQSLYQLTHSIQKQHSPHLRPFVEGEIQFVGYTDQDDQLQAMHT